MVFYVRLAWFFSHAAAKAFPSHAAGAILHTAFMAFWLMMGGGSIPI
jgi:hypothetical protein